MTIPITFTFSGKTYSGNFNKIMGAASSASFYLIIDGLFFGNLSYIDPHPGFNGLHSVEGGWRFTSNTPGMESMAEEFGRMVVSWLDGQG